MVSTLRQLHTWELRWIQRSYARRPLPNSGGMNVRTERYYNDNREVAVIRCLVIEFDDGSVSEVRLDRLRDLGTHGRRSFPGAST